MHDSIKTFDVCDLQDLKGSSRSQFRSEPLTIYISGVDAGHITTVAKTIKDCLLAAGQSVKGPLPLKRSWRANYAVRLPGSNNEVVKYESIRLHRRVIYLPAPTQSSINQLIQLSIPSGAKVKIVPGNPQGFNNKLSKGESSD